MKAKKTGVEKGSRVCCGVFASNPDVARWRAELEMLRCRRCCRPADMKTVWRAIRSTGSQEYSSCHRGNIAGSMLMLSSDIFSWCVIQNLTNC